MSLRSAMLALATSDDGGDVRALNDVRSERLRPGNPMYNPCLADGTPLIYAFYPDNHPPVVSTLLEQWARGLFRRLVTEKPDTLVACEGRTLDEARAILVDAGVNGVPRVTKQVTINGPGRFRIEPNVTGVTLLSSSISIFERCGGRGQRLGCATCYILGGGGGDEAVYFDLPRAATIKINVGLRDPDGPVFVRVDGKTLEPVDGGGLVLARDADSPGGVRKGVRDNVRDCGDVKDE